jgi:hypothetical protein
VAPGLGMRAGGKIALALGATLRQIILPSTISMKKSLVLNLMATIACATLCPALPRPAAAQSKPAVIPAQDPVAAANRAFELAWAKPDRLAVETMLDPGFTWIDAAGVLLSRDEALANWPAPAAVSSAGEVSVRVYGARVALLQVHAGHTYVLRVFVNEAKLGWRLLHVIEAVQKPAPRYAVPGQADKTGVLPSESGVETDCINPCREIPFHAPTLNARAAVSSWQQMEIGAAARDVNAWGYHVAEEAFLVDSAGDGAMDKKQYAADTMDQKDSGVMTNQAPPLVWGRTYDYGDIVVLLTLQQPYQGKPFYAARVFVNRDSRFQMVASYYAAIRNVPIFTLSDQDDDP